MEIRSLDPLATSKLAAATSPLALSNQVGDEQPDKAKLRETFDQFVGELFYGQMLKAMRQSVGKPAYFHGGRAEEIFQDRLDQVLAEEMTAASASSFTGPMFELFALSRQ